MITMTITIITTNTVISSMIPLIFSMINIICLLLCELCKLLIINKLPTFYKQYRYYINI